MLNPMLTARRFLSIRSTRAALLACALALACGSCSTDSTLDRGEVGVAATVGVAANSEPTELPTPQPTLPEPAVQEPTSTALPVPTAPRVPTAIPVPTVPPDPTGTPEPSPTPPPVATLAPVADVDPLGLAGTHGLTLQWISWQPSDWGRVEFVPLVDGTYHVSGRQDGADGDYVSLDGTMTVISDRELRFNGLVRMQIMFNNDGRPCDRRGELTFLATGERRFWRMQDLLNCDGIVTDYVDIYFG